MIAVASGRYNVIRGAIINRTCADRGSPDGNTRGHAADRRLAIAANMTNSANSWPPHRCCVGVGQAKVPGFRRRG